MDLRNPYPYTLYDDEWDFVDYQRSCLSGKINPSLLSIKHLYYLDLSWNDFQGIHIPNFLGNLTSLRYLNLSYASFSGEIPHFLGNLSNLNYLDLDYSRHSNDLGETLFSKNLSWLSRLSSLKYLNLGGVNLSMAGVSCLHYVNMLPSLLELHLSRCGFDSNQLLLSLPALNFTSLSVLDMSANYVNSSLPSWLSSLTSLRTLDLDTNLFPGPIPDEFSSFKNLMHLDLSYNQLEGQIPKLIGNFCTLKTLSLAENLFGMKGLQDVLNGLTDCSNTRLESLDLSLNGLDGELPASIGRLHKLQYLNLEGNSFLGSIPESFGNLSSLKELILSANRLTSIPESLGQLSQLVHLDLSHNLWEGSLTEFHFINLTKLDSFGVSTDRPIPLIFNMTYDWVPPFKLRQIHIENCLVGDAFLVWIQSQTELLDVTLSGTEISGIPEDWLLKISPQIEILDLSNNQIQGKLPFQSKFPQLYILDLSRNRFSKSIPLNFGLLMPNLEWLSLSDNHLDGPIPPPSICEMQYMWILSLRNNQFSGEFPRAWSLWGGISDVDVSENNLSGNIPSSMGIPSSLVILKMSNNNFGGKIPSSLQNCSLLSRIDLGGNNLSGNLPSWIGSNSMVTFNILQLRSNSFSGHIPKHLCNLVNLHVLDLAHNNFSGTIPKCLDKLGSEDSSVWNVYRYAEQTTIVSKGRDLQYGSSNVDLVKGIDLSSNNLEGEIPEEMSSLIELSILNLSRNHLHGKIPTNIGNMSSLEILDLSHNHLLGEIPQSLSALNYLNHLNLSYNNFSGRIPSGNQLRTLTDPSIYEGNPSLCGFPLSTKCPGDDKPTSSGNIPVEDNDEDENKKLGLYVSIALGFITGFWGICGTLLVKKSWRYAYFRFFDNIKKKIIVGIAVKVARLRRRNL